MFAAIAWITVLLIPVRPAGTRERLDAGERCTADLSDVTVLIPARNEGATIARTLEALSQQGPGLRVVVVDDQSTDATAAIVGRWPSGGPLRQVQLIRGAAPEPGWLGKVRAQAQGLEHINTPFVLLMDADIALAPGMLAALKERIEPGNLGLVSVMARLRTDSFWERLLVPAYIYFFKLLYPFALVNSPRYTLAAAAGGCMLARRTALDEIGGFESLKNAIIDDCTLARLIKDAGYPIWLGLSHGVTSNRPYDSLPDLWNLVARSAFAELRFSVARLLICTAAMAVLFILPVLGPVLLPRASGYLSTSAALAMFISYAPILRFYELHTLRALTLPAVALAYLAMTWHSAVRYWLGTRTVWKERRYKNL